MLDCIIIGGGISGLSFAHYLKRAGERILVLEKDDRMGGRICTKPCAVADDFGVELGTHTCYNSYTHFLKVVSEAGLTDRVLALDKRPYRLSVDGRVKSISSEMSFLSMIPGCFRIFFSSKRGKSVQAFFSPVVGKTNYEHLFRHLFRAVICQNADAYPAEFFLKRRKERIEVVPRKFSYRNGFSTLVSDLIAHSGLPVKTNSCVTGVERENEGFVVLTADGHEYRTRHVAFAIDPPGVARLIKDVSPDAANVFDDIPVVRSEALGIIVRKEHIGMQEVAVIVPTSGEFLSVVSRDVLNHPELRGFTFHFFAESKTEAEKLETACRILGIRASEVLDTVSASHVLPSPRIQHTGTIDRVKQLCANEQMFFLGNYYYGLSVEDCVHRSHEEFKRYEGMDGKVGLPKS